MNQLSEFHARLLLGGMDFFALDEVDVDPQAILPGRERTITGGNLRVAFRAHIPDCRRIFDDESQVMAFELAEDARRVGAEGVAHVGVEAIIHLGEDQIEVRFGGATFLQLVDPELLEPGNQISAVVEKDTQFLGIRPPAAEEFHGIEAIEALHFAAHVGI